MLNPITYTDDYIEEGMNKKLEKKYTIHFYNITVILDYGINVEFG